MRTVLVYEARPVRPEHRMKQCTVYREQRSRWSNEFQTSQQSKETGMKKTHTQNAGIFEIDPCVRVCCCFFFPSKLPNEKPN